MNGPDPAAAATTHRYTPTDAEVLEARDELVALLSRLFGGSDPAARESMVAHITLGRVDALLEHADRAHTTAEVKNDIRRARAALEAQKQWHDDRSTAAEVRLEANR